MSQTVLTCRQISTRWTSDERLKQVPLKHKFQRILLRGFDNPGTSVESQSCLFLLSSCVYNQFV